MYLTYNEYINMGGTLNQALFNDLEFQSEIVVNWYTFNRLKNDTNIPTEVKHLIKYLITLSKQKMDTLGINEPNNQNTSGTSIASQSNDGVSVSYNVLTASEIMQNLKSTETSVVQHYLNGITNEAGRLLLYRGVYPDE